MEDALRKKKVTSAFEEGFICKICEIMTRNEMSVEILNDDAETVKEFLLSWKRTK